MRYAMPLLALLACSCAKPSPLPVYPPADAETSLEIIRSKSDAIRTVQSEATIVLTDAKGESVSVDGVLLFQRPDRLRVRAWKLGQAVFDLTVTPDGVWQYTPRHEAKGAMGITQQVARRLVELIASAPPTQPTTVLLDSQTVTVVGRPQDASSSRSEYARSTLVLKRYVVSDELGQDRFVLLFDDHRVVGDHVWPMRIEAKSEQGVISIRFGDVEINSDLPATAFAPPARTERVP